MIQLYWYKNLSSFLCFIVFGELIKLKRISLFMQKVIVIDSGLSECFKNKGFNIDGFTVSSDGNHFSISNSYSDVIGHGTAVMDILTSYHYKDDVSFIMVKLFDAKGEATEEALCFALEYIKENIECKLIHISSGVTCCVDEERLEDCCQQLSAKGIILVSAFDNLGAISYPAAFSCVIGVDYDMGKRTKFQYQFLKNSPVNLLVSYSEQFVQWKDGIRKNVNGNSFIAPHISARILQYCSEHLDCGIDEIMLFLEAHATCITNYNPPENSLIKSFSIGKAVIFPFNKEVHTIARFEQQLSFEVEDYYDVKYLGNVMRNVSDILPNVKSSHIVKNIEYLCWDSDFDTLILGHTDIIERLTNRPYARELIDNCLRYHKNLYLFDAINITQSDIDKFHHKGLHLFISSMHQHDYSNQLGKLYSISVPILAIFGTSSRQGKFTLQIELRRRFLADGYSVGQLGTEPTSILFDMDEEYPLGYNSGNELSPMKNIENINYLIHKIQKKRPDIIIIGSQSHTVPLGYGNLRAFPVYQQDLLFGALPDACIVCVNISDEINYIRRSIQYIASLTETPSIAVCLSPFGEDTKWTLIGSSKDMFDITRLVERKKVLEQELQIPVFLYDELDELYQCVLDFF